jgi:hypothetical protein
MNIFFCVNIDGKLYTSEHVWQDGQRLLSIGEYGGLKLAAEQPQQLFKLGLCYSATFAFVIIPWNFDKKKWVGAGEASVVYSCCLFTVRRPERTVGAKKFYPIVPKKKLLRT